MCMPGGAGRDVGIVSFSARAIEGRVGEGREYSLGRKGYNKVVTREKGGITSGVIDGSSLLAS